MHSSKLWKFHVSVDDEVVDPVTDYSHTAHADTCAIIYERLSVIQTMIRLRSPILRYQTDHKNSSQVKTLTQFNWKLQLEHLTEQQLAILDQFALADCFLKLLDFMIWLNMRFWSLMTLNPTVQGLVLGSRLGLGSLVLIDSQGTGTLSC